MAFGMDEVAVLVLNGSFEPLHFTNARRAIILLLSGKAESVEVSPRVIRSPSHSFPLPSVIRLALYIRKPFVERVAFNKKNILRRDHHACQYCGRRGDRLTVDHVVPRSRGGDTTWTNVVAACLRCNLNKGNRTLTEAGMVLVRQPSHPQFLFSLSLLRSPHAPLFLDAWRKYLSAVPAAVPSGV
jgi:5-methylcytosine-specific restriction endonuclease McrA